MAMTTEQEIANILAAIGQNLKHLVAAEVAQANFNSNGKIPQDEKRGRHADLERGPRPPGPPRKD
jgi:hypothetical protein